MRNIANSGYHQRVALYGAQLIITQDKRTEDQRMNCAQPLTAYFAGPQLILTMFYSFEVQQVDGRLDSGPGPESGSAGNLGSSCGPKNGLQEGGDRSWKFTHQMTIVV